MAAVDNCRLQLLYRYVPAKYQIRTSWVGPEDVLNIILSDTVLDSVAAGNSMGINLPYNSNNIIINKQRILPHPLRRPMVVRTLEMRTTPVHSGH